MRDFPFQALTFDCFGTLMDWRAGQALAWSRMASLSGIDLDTPALDRARMAAEIRIQAREWMPYSRILAISAAEAVREVHARELPEAEADAFAAAQAQWSPFPDSREALAGLSALAPIGLLSNCDHAVLERAATDGLRLEDPTLISSESVRSYKPAPTHWQAALQAFSCRPEEVLHVSAYAHYDLNPAAELGFRLAFIARDNEPCPAYLELDYEAEDLAGLLQQLVAD